MEERLSTEETDVANVAFAKNVQGAAELVGVNPPEIAAGDFASGEIAEVARGVAGIGDGDIAEGRTAAGDEAEHVPRFGGEIGHRYWVGAGKAQTEPARWSGKD